MNGAIEHMNWAAAVWWQWTLTSTWQGVVLLVVVGIILYGAKFLRPGMRYGLLLVVLLKLAMPPVVGMSYGFSDLMSHLMERPPAQSLTAPDMTVSLGPPTIEAGEVLLLDQVTVAPRPALTWYSWLLMVQLVGGMAILYHIARQMTVARRLWRNAVPQAQSVHERLHAIAQRMGLRRVPPLRVSTSAQTPQTGGIVRPYIVLPHWAVAMPVESLDILLAHELAHVKRRDVLVNGVQALVQALLWWNPLVWWLNRRIREEREFCCDDLVLARGIADGVAYSKTLVRVAERVSVPSTQWATVGMADAFHVVDLRVRRALAERRVASTGSGYVAAVALLVLSGWVLPGRAPAEGDERNQGPEGQNFSMDVSGLVYLTVGKTGTIENLDNGRIFFESEAPGTRILMITGERLTIYPRDEDSGRVEIRGDISATIDDTTITAPRLDFDPAGFVVFEDALREVRDDEGVASAYQEKTVKVDLATRTIEPVVDNPSGENNAAPAKMVDEQRGTITIEAWIVELDRDADMQFADGVTLAGMLADEQAMSVVALDGESWANCEAALEKCSGNSDGEILARPRLTTPLGQQATIEIGPAVTESKVPLAAGSEMGLKLAVLPTGVYESEELTGVELVINYERRVAGEPVDGKTVSDRCNLESNMLWSPEHAGMWFLQIVETDGEHVDVVVIRPTLVE